jgi:hypothetical protein
MSNVEERFETFDKPIEDYILEQENKDTRAKTDRDVRLLIYFLRQKNELQNPEESPPEELNGYLSEFINSVKRKDGEDYEPSSLRGFISSFHRHLKERNLPRM